MLNVHIVHDIAASLLLRLLIHLTRIRIPSRESCLHTKLPSLPLSNGESRQNVLQRRTTERRGETERRNFLAFFLSLWERSFHSKGTSFRKDMTESKTPFRRGCSISILERKNTIITSCLNNHSIAIYTALLSTLQDSTPSFPAVSALHFRNNHPPLPKEEEEK